MFRCLSSCCKKKKKKIKEVYVLKLEYDNYYVGESNDVKRRIWLHENGNGSAWTKKYNVIEQQNTITKKQKHLWELSETLQQIALHGINNVRGSMFTNPNFLSKQEKIMAAQLFCEMNNFCRKCGKSGHFITSCHSNDKADWVSNFGGELEFNKSLSIRKCINCSKDITLSPNYYKYCKDCFKK